ncbi:Na+/H+ antiporter NhaA [Frigoribacterium sp. 2-23]|uniref:Na+/H+ antiporter NhaA n=1 Tax=Frigoribacterium sp. 2-23 TaxID=3415006 RepID=UPI003C7028DC
MSSSPSRPSSPGARLAAFVSRDVVGGALLLAATVLALVLANTGAAGWYAAVRDTTIGPASLHLDLSVGAWAADGLLAIFFFVVGLELKQEFVAGSLRDPRVAAIPVVAAVGGVALPAVIYTLINLGQGPEALQGWAIPAATDIAFATAVLAVVGKGLPPALRVFLLTLAVVDDLLAITIIAVFYTSAIAFGPLLLALVPLGLFALAVQRGVRAWWLLIPLGVLTWVLVHASGIHATIAGVALGLVVPVVASRRTKTEQSGVGLTHAFAHTWSPWSAGIAVPVFAFFSAGVTVGGIAGLVESFGDSVTVGIAVALVVGKTIGITGGTFLVTRLPGLRLDPTVRWPDIVGMSCVAGIGFTVSLLVGELAFGPGSTADDHVKVGVLTGSLVAAVVGGAMLAVRARGYRRGAAAG